MKQKRKGLSDAYIDQQLQVAKTMCKKASDNDLISADTLKPFDRVNRLLKKGSDVRDVVVSVKQFHKLMRALSPFMRPIVATAYYTGMRRGEILNLTWDRVDLVNKTINLEAIDTKDRESRTIPICNELYLIFKDTPKAIHTNRVFLYNGSPINDTTISIKRACIRAGIPYGRKVKGGITFHDFRHTFNTNMRRAGVPEGVIMKITGHSTRAMFDRYDSVDHQDMKDAVDRMTTRLENAYQSAYQK